MQRLDFPIDPQGISGKSKSLIRVKNSTGLGFIFLYGSFVLEHWNIGKQMAAGFISEAGRFFNSKVFEEAVNNVSLRY